MVVWFRCSLPRAPSGRVDCFSSFWGRFPRIASLPAARTSSGANFVLPLRGAEPLRGLRCRLAIESSIQLILTFLWFRGDGGAADTGKFLFRDLPADTGCGQRRLTRG
jgi:hypothetical protein